MRSAVFRVDASARVGGGHFMRCLTLADALVGDGAAVAFACAQLTDSARALLASRGYEVQSLAMRAPEEEYVEGWEMRPWDAAIQHLDATEFLARAGAADYVVVDHYRLDRHWETRVGRSRLLAIDDLANRRHDAAGVLDQNLGRAPTDYADLTPPGAALLLGPGYALLRPEFPALRDRALERRDGRPVERIVLSLGSTDLNGCTGRVLHRVLEQIEHEHVDVVLAANAPSMPVVSALAQNDPRITIHSDSQAMSELMTAADVAVGAAGTTSWERCCLGLPTVTLVLAENQREIGRQLASHGAALVVDEGALSAQLALLLGDSVLRRRLAATGAKLVDGRGAGRVAEYLKTRAFGSGSL